MPAHLGDAEIQMLARSACEQAERFLPPMQCGFGGLMGLYSYEMWCPGNGVKLDEIPYREWN